MREYVIDATAGCLDGMFIFCPIEGDIAGEFIVVTGLNYLSNVPPNNGIVVAIVHEQGQEAVEVFCDEFALELEKLQEKMGRHTIDDSKED